MLKNFFSPLTSLLKLILVVLVIVVGFVFWQLVIKSDRFQVNTSHAAIIQEIIKLQRLETAAFTIEKVIDAKTTTNNSLTDFLFGDKLLLIAHGQVVAGVDLEKLTAADVKIEGKKVTLNLPPTEIFHTMLNEQKTMVYDRTQGLLTKGDQNLESAARQAAQESIKKAACEGEILTYAADNARKQLTALLQGFGFEQVQVNITAGKCE